MHFVGHYFHYDSKFWQTLKALWFSPGKLTIAYWNQQRMRYLPPISLYIFISAVYFIGFYSSFHKDKTNTIHINRGHGVSFTNSIRNTVDSLDDNMSEDTTQQSAFSAFITKKMDKVVKEYGGLENFFSEKVFHDVPKVFFLMIPLMALVLRILFLRKKGIYFVHHAVFSLHYHSFWFSIFFLSAINRIHGTVDALRFILFLVAFIYMIVALRRVYNTGVAKAIIYSILISISYAIFFVFAFLAYFLTYVAIA